MPFRQEKEQRESLLFSYLKAGGPFRQNIPPELPLRAKCPEDKLKVIHSFTPWSKTSPVPRKVYESWRK